MNLIIHLYGEGVDHDFERFKNHSVKRAKEFMRELMAQFGSLYKGYTHYKIEELDKDCYESIRTIEEGEIIREEGEVVALRGDA